jgi:hypothetical protein
MCFHLTLSINIFYGFMKVESFLGLVRVGWKAVFQAG